jgi:hypothetical protein
MKYCRAFKVEFITEDYLKEYYLINCYEKYPEVLNKCRLSIQKAGAVRNQERHSFGLTMDLRNKLNKS